MPTARDRAIVVVDVKTSGDEFNRLGHAPVEIAWWNLATGDSGDFLVKHNVQYVTDFGDPDALRALRYVERGLGDQDQDLNHRELIRLESHLYANTLAAVDVARVARLLALQYKLVPPYLRPNWDDNVTTNEPWHPRLLDLASFASGTLGTAPGRLDSLADLAAALDVDPFREGTAAGDVHTAGECLLELIARSEDQHHRGIQLRRFFGGRRRARQAVAR
ncbi:Hypothetical protein AJAP_42705 (plasmid) [Amycolatopsis japonica]|uniref:Uncharacterized protein n=1 Tax=Amycolatopsis japonica TaxID=208439 RepID=A0A075V763_9PSEU|nr:hypothetical protein [Amycolatopsis japonica]AIG81308.1 Hypothetical protein AJAP_42705 [Amycolatopsis japonica]